MKVLQKYLIFYSLLLFANCAYSPEKHIIGKWVSVEPIDKTIDDIYHNNLAFSKEVHISYTTPSEDEMLKIAEDILTWEEIGNKSIEFFKDGTTSAEKLKNYKFIDKNLVELVLEDQLGGKSIINVKVKVSQNKLTLILPNGDIVEFSRL